MSKGEGKARTAQSLGGGAVPLVVDLDGTLIASDLLHEFIVASLARNPFSAFGAVAALLRGKAQLKQHLSEAAAFDPTRLPYRESVLDFIREAQQAGRPIVLATASDERSARAVAAHLGLFDEVLASTPTLNLSGRAKAEALVARFGDAGFDYIGDSRADLAVWAHARRCYAVGAHAGVLRKLRASTQDVEVIEVPKLTPSTWIRAFRIHQYAKNALVFVPIITAHKISVGSVWNSLLAFVAMSLAASAIYLVNDLVDLADDRSHPSKRRRPIASGALSVRNATLAVPILLLASATTAGFLPPAFWAALATYLFLTTAYSFWLKRKMILDVVVLAFLYSIRIIAGGAATSIAISNWLLGLCVFAFSCLALIKRYNELLVRIDNGLPDSDTRNYQKGDAFIVAGLAAATGSNAAIVLALYISSPEVAENYKEPRILWLLCPLVMYLLSRALLMAHRRLMDDDPIVWALKDQVCRIGLVTAIVILVLGAVV